MASPAELTPGRSRPLLYPFQAKYVADPARFKSAMFSRQTGKTFTTTLECADSLFEAQVKKERCRWVIFSRGERQSREAMEDGLQRHIEAYSKVLGKFRVSDWDYYESDGEEMIKRTALEREWPNGNRVTALPSSPDTARGFSANVLLDEFAIHQRSREMWAAVFPIISAGWKLRVCSTPKGRGNRFYEIMTKDDPKFPWSRHICDIWEAVRQGLPRDPELLRAALDDEDTWKQEYELEWLEEASTWLSFELINGVESDVAGIPDRYNQGHCFVGVDIGRRKDLFVIWVCEYVGDVLWTREIIEKKGISFAEQDALLDQVMNRYRVARVCMDQTGMGEKPVEDAKHNYGDSVVEGVLFTGPAKLVLATHGKERFQDRTIRIPMGNEKLRSDLSKLKKETTLTGAPRFVADRDENDHADRAWACFLACYAAGGGPRNFEYTPGPSKQERNNEGGDGGAGRMRTEPPSAVDDVKYDSEGAY